MDWPDILTLFFITVKPIIDEGISQSPTIENGVITVKVGSPVFIVKGFNVNIICDVTSREPPMTFSWFCIEQPDQCRRNVSTITVMNPTEDDVITCRVDNKFGFDKKDTHKGFCIISCHKHRYFTILLSCVLH